MTVHVLIAVFNRLAHTRKVIDALRAQTRAEDLNIVIIDDGSTDGTATWLAEQNDVRTLKGNGNLWWGGAMQLGLEHVLAEAGEQDHVLFLNNDTWFAPDYVDTLLRVSREAGGAIVGSVVHEEGRDPPLAHVGPRLNVTRLATWDIVSELSAEEIRHPRSTYVPDALSGRGTLFPVGLFRRYGGLRPKLLPHYFADYEISMRFARHGVPLRVSSEAIVVSPPVYGAEVKGLGWWDRLFSPRSSSNLFHRTAFFLLVGSPWQRLTAPLRLVAFGAWRAWRGLSRRRGLGAAA